MGRRDGKMGCGGCLLLVIAVPIVFAVVIMASKPPQVDGPAIQVAIPSGPVKPRTDDDAFRPGQEVLIVNDHGLKIVSILSGGEFVHLPNPTRARITDGRLRSRNGVPFGYEVEVIEGEHAGLKGVAGVNALRP